MGEGSRSAGSETTLSVLVVWTLAGLSTPVRLPGSLGGEEGRSLGRRFQIGPWGPRVAPSSRGWVSLHTPLTPHSHTAPHSTLKPPTHGQHCTYRAGRCSQLSMLLRTWSGLQPSTHSFTPHPRRLHPPPSQPHWGWGNPSSLALGTPSRSPHTGRTRPLTARPDLPCGRRNALGEIASYVPVTVSPRDEARPGFRNMQ